MSLDEDNNRKSKMDRLIMLLALFGVFLFGILLTNDRYFDMLFGLGAAQDNRPQVGEITYSRNDTRHKRLTSFAWNKADEQQRVLVGDGVFTGADSYSKVRLKVGGEVDLGPNTLVYFREIDGIELPDLSSGSFKLNVDGKMKVALNGEIVELEGSKSEVEILLGEDQKPQFRLLKGDAKAKIGFGPADPITARGLASEVNKPAPVTVSLPPPLETRIGKLAAPKSFHYPYQLYDVYEIVRGLEMRYKPELPSEVPLPVRLNWTLEGPGKDVYFQHAKAGFEKAPVTGPIAESYHDVKKVHVGPNQWRLSLDGQNWVEPSTFEVTMGPYTAIAPELIFSESIYVIEDEGEAAQIQAKVVTTEPFKYYIVERSENPNFPKADTRAWWLRGTKFRVSTRSVGSYYFRVRGVNERAELGAFSKNYQIGVRKQDLLVAPILARTKIDQFFDQPADLAWSKPMRAKKFEVQFFDKNGKLLRKKDMSAKEFALRVKKPGLYQYRVTAIDAKGRRSPPSAVGKLVLRPRPEIAKAPKEEERKPAAVNRQATKPPPRYPHHQRNVTYPNSKVYLEGSTFTMFSGEQEGVIGAPFAMTAGLRVRHWFDDHGVDGFLKSKVLAANEEGNLTSPTQVEVRYLHRWFIPFNFLSNIRETQFSLLMGYEMYRNPSGGDYFSPKYDLIKSGFSLEFPLAYNWDTGGEVLYGFGLDNSKKTEISGHINYYLKRQFSFGVGYRVHLFEAGSAAASPLGLPFREGYGEGYSVLRWHY